jgi:hypothetical protein
MEFEFAWVRLREEPMALRVLLVGQRVGFTRPKNGQEGFWWICG